MRADAPIGHGEPVLVTTCEGVGAIHENEEIIEGPIEGSQTIVRTFSVDCPCDEVEVMARQYTAAVGPWVAYMDIMGRPGVA